MKKERFIPSPLGGEAWGQEMLKIFLIRGNSHREMSRDF